MKNIINKKYTVGVCLIRCLLIATGILIASFDSIPLYANPQGGQVIAGSASINQAVNTVTVNQNSNAAIINWNSFSIAKNETTQFVQPSSSSVALNRVIGNNPSQIFGNLTANGKIILVNQNGIFFGEGSTVDVAGLIATTADISNQNFLNGNYQFTQNPNKNFGIVNNGTITARDAGLVALVAPGVENNGTIQANLGKVVLASGRAFTVVDTYGDGLIEFAPNAQITQAPLTPNGKVMTDAVANRGTIIANGGTVLMTARAAVGVVNDVVNMKGVVQANSVHMHNGTIILSGGTSGVVSVSGKIYARGIHKHQTGGTVKIVGQDIGLFSGTDIDVSGQAGGGTVLIGGGEHGTSIDVENLPNAQAVYVDPNATINANALTTGNGGTIIAWSDDATRFYGTANAQGGVQSGNGGFIETSAAWIDVNGANISAAAYHGTDGTWLLDPTDITISTSGNSNGSFTGGSWVPNFAATSNINNGSINSLLNSNTNVTINTASAFPGIAGNITQDASANISTTGTATLQLIANNNITLNGNIDGSGLSLILTTPGTININGAIGSTSRINSLGTNNTTAININNNISVGVANSGFITFTGPVVIGANVSIIAGGKLTFGSTINDSASGAHTLTLLSGNAVNPAIFLNGSIGNINPLSSFSASTFPGGTMTFVGNLIATTGAGGINLNGGFVLNDPTTFSATGGPITANNPNNKFNNYLVTLKNTGNNAVKVSTASGNLVLGSVTVGGNLTATAPNSIILNNPITANGTGNAIVLAGSTFINNAGANVFTTNNGNWLVYSTNPANDVHNGLTSNFIQYNIAYPTAPVASSNGFLYTLAPVITVNLIGTTTKTYNSNTNATLAANNYSLSGAVAGDTITLNNPTSGTYATKNVGTGLPVTASGVAISSATNGSATVYGYRLASTNASGGIGTITPANLTISDIVAEDKIYNGNTLATLEDDGVLNGVIGSDVVNLNANNINANFANKNVGDNKIVTVTNYSLSGADAANYVINHGLNSSTTTASITPATIDVTAESESRVYNGTTNSSVTPHVGTLYTTDTIATEPTQTFDTKDVGKGKTLTPAGLVIDDGVGGADYDIVYINNDHGVITPASLTVTAVSDSRVYNGEILSTATPVITGTIYAGDAITTNAIQTFNNPNVGAGKTLTPSGLLIDDGVGGDDYTVTYVSRNLGTITPALLSITGSTLSRTFGAANPTTTEEFSYTGLVGSDSLSTVNVTGAPSPSSNVGSYTWTPANVVFSNGTASNYSISYNPGVFNITTATLTLNVAGGALTRVYGAANPATTTQFNAMGLVNGNSISMVSVTNAPDATAAVGNHYTWTPADAIFSNGSASNYNITYTDGAFSITPATLTATLIGTVSKTYNANTTATLNAGNYALSGILNNDVVELNNPTLGSYDTKNVGINKNIIVTGLAITGFDAGNYVVNTSANANIGTITPAAVTATLVGTVSKTYDANTTAILTANNYELTGIQANDTVALNNPVNGLYDTKEVGTNINVAVVGLAISGADASNYTVNPDANANIGTITPANLTVTNIVARNKVYNGNTTATLSNTGVLNGVLGTDEVSLNNINANFDDENVGSNKLVTATYTLEGPAKNDYVLNNGLNTGTTTAMITPAALIITANDATRFLSDSNPTFTVSYSGLVGGDTSSVVSGLVINSTATASSPPGNYFIIPSSGNASNYNISYVNGELTILPEAAPDVPSIIYFGPNTFNNTTGYANNNNLAFLNEIYGCSAGSDKNSRCESDVTVLNKKTPTPVITLENRTKKIQRSTPVITTPVITTQAPTEYAATESQPAEQKPMYPEQAYVEKIKEGHVPEAQNADGQIESTQAVQQTTYMEPSSPEQPQPPPTEPQDEPYLKQIDQ